jgi:outer membrane protein TolC
LREAQNNLQKQNIAIRYTQNNLLPSASVFGLYAGSGLQGNAVTSKSGAWGSLGQTFGAVYPEGAYGALFSASIRNRSAQADNLRAQLERNQLEIGLESTRNQIELQVQQARIGLIQGQAQIEAAHEAVVLAQQSRDAEREKLMYGVSTPYNVVLKERDLVSAQYAQVQVQSAYAKAVIAMDQATGTTLERNGIRLEDALSGTVAQKPTPPLASPAIPDRKGGGR